MTQLLIQEDAFWRQRAKVHWLRDGDLNTKFFHAAASSRRKVNKITSLVEELLKRISCVMSQKIILLISSNLK